LSRAIMYSTEPEMTVTGPPTSFIGSGKRFPRSIRSSAGRRTSAQQGPPADPRPRLAGRRS
jgi:hypothetical protein